MRQRRLTGVEHAGEIGLDDLCPLIRRHRGDVGEDADAGVVDEEVEAAEARGGGLDRAAYLIVTADVGLQRLDSAGPGGFDLRTGRRQVRRIATGDRHLHAVGDKRARDRQPDAAGPARHQRHLPAE